MNSIKRFNTEPFINALKSFYTELNVPINYLADEPANAESILGDKFKSENPAHKLIKNIYAVGIVNDEIFKGKKSFTVLSDVKKFKSDYNGLLLFGIELNNRPDNLLPTRSQLAEISRVFNRVFPYTPVTIIFKYQKYLSFANSERVKYKQEWREGEKIGKISLLKDISIEQTHRGHIAILKQLEISTSGRNAVTNFTQLYYYWQSVFSISVLNKTFYEEIITWFNKAVTEIKIPSSKPGSEKHKDFTVRLIARLIFIWFLKELGVVSAELLVPKSENGDENYLIKPKTKGGNYYKFILQNLFFNALNSENKERNKEMFDIYSSSFDSPEKIKNIIFKAPYLNGGLFDKHVNDWCELEKSFGFEVPDNLFLEEEKGLNSILLKYKFTIAENTPLEEEIAVDPEMLGRIFENLLAEQSDDTKDAARKNAGAFYTPRPVVSYMCRSTLLKHLGIEIKPENKKEIIKKLLETTVLDPACGSGAFPIGMLEEMMQVLTTVDPDGKAWVAEMLKSDDKQFREHISEMYADGQIRYIKKLGILRNCLFGVDLLEYAIEISKLRCWLSLIVEQKVELTKEKENYNLKPLPNLEFKFYKKNSLFRLYKNQNLNTFVEVMDKDNLLKELVNLENQYFITKSDRHGTKEEIKEKIVQLLERVVDSNINVINKELVTARGFVNLYVSQKASQTIINRAKKKVLALSSELGELAKFRFDIKDYFIERVVFPGIFNKETKNPGFDIVIGNPPYVNTKLLSSMGLTEKMKQEYGYCDDLYNHFTIRGLELLKEGGLLSYITSDTFLTLQTKQNMRMQFLGISSHKSIANQEKLFDTELTEYMPPESPDLFGNSKPEQSMLIPIKVDKPEKSNDGFLPVCKLIEVINTPKAFAALVDTAIFSIKREVTKINSEIVYVDLRKPNADSFDISQEEWKQIRTSRENLAGWERVLDRTFNSLGHNIPNWKLSHTCDGDKVFRDSDSPLLKFKVSLQPYRKAINYAIFSPNEYNCEILEKIIKPARSVFDKWWEKIETSREYERNRNIIQKSIAILNPHSLNIIGLLADGGQGMATGNNGRFVGYQSTSRFAEDCKLARVQKLWEAIQSEPKLTRKFTSLASCKTYESVEEILDSMSETEIWRLFDEIKDKFGLRMFGKGFMYRVISNTMIFNIAQISDKEKKEGIKGNKVYVPYDKGDRDGNRWYLKTPYLIDWSIESVNWLKSNSGQSGTGMPVVRNPQFYFRTGFCWTNVLNPNSVYFKCRLKDSTVNDVGSMSLYDESGLGDKYFVVTLNSYLHFKILREFFNNTVNIQMNDIRKLPIKIPTDKELKLFNKKFDDCLEIKKDYFKNEIDYKEMIQLLKPIEDEIDELVNNLYGIKAKEEIIIDDFEEVEVLKEIDEDE